MIKVTKKKNPLNYYKELEKLVGKNVIVKINSFSDNFYFTVEGKLENNSYYFSVRNVTKNESAQIHFNDKMVKSIKNNFIEVSIEPNNDILEEIKTFGQGRMHILPLDVLNQIVIVTLASKLRWPFVMGKLKYNKVNDFYYIQDYNHLMQVHFTENMIFNVRKNKYVSFDIISEDVNKLWRVLNDKN